MAHRKMDDSYVLFCNVKKSLIMSTMIEVTQNPLE